MHALIKRNHEFWNHERSLRALLIYMSISLFVWIPIAGFGREWWGFLLSEALFSLIILAGVFSVLTRWRNQLFFITNAILATVFRILFFFVSKSWILSMGYVFSIVFLALLARKVLQHIFKEGPVNFYRIQGSIVVFMIIGIVCAMLYTLIETLLPGSFVSTQGSQNYADLFSQQLYFSFVVMTTLGFGDTIPTGSLAKSLVIFQGMTGLLYPVVMIARLVTLEVTHSAQIKK